VLVTVAAVAFVAGLGTVFTAKIDGTVVVDNPNRPSEAFCEMRSNDTFSEINDTGFDCSGPAEIERNVDPLIQRTLGSFYGAMLIGFPIVILVTGILLHAGTALCNGEGSFADTLAVTAWGLSPFLVTMPLGLLALWLLMDPVSVTPGTAPEAIQRTVMASLDPWVPVAVGLNLVGSVWGAAIWTFGLERGRDVTRGQAALVAGVVTLFLILGGLA
jgi:hypothetical protein